MLARESSQASTAAGSFSPAVKGESTSPPSTTSARPIPQIPDHELLRCIGRGSYVEVWLARSALGFHRALKIVYRATFDSDRPYEREFEGIRKFEPVSRSHQSQVDILHVGRNDAAGCFYYVMELADDQQTGARIDPAQYEPKTLRSELKQRGRLPFQECRDIALALTTALGHLHKHGLVHRDVKPSNIIFVNGLPKLADIGLVATVDATCSFVGTEGYLPPEGPGSPQADLYSLGKVLYEISTGKDRREFPELPVSADANDDETGTRELNEIILRACEKDVRKRYTSAEQMREELLLLQAGRSVRHLRKVEYRLAVMTRVGVATGAALVLAAIAYFGAIQQARRASRLARVEAEQHQRADLVVQFLKDMLTSVKPSVALGRDGTLLREIMDQTAKRVGKDLKGQPEVEIELRNLIGDVYRELGLYDRAEAMHRAALEMAKSLPSTENPLVALSLNELALALDEQNKLQDAEKLARQALEIRTNLFVGAHPEVAESLTGLGIMLEHRGQYAEAEALHRQALAMHRTLFGNQHPRVAISLNCLAQVVKEQGRFPEAEDLWRKALAIQREEFGDGHPDTATSLHSFAVFLEGRGRLAEAETAHRDAQRAWRKLLGDKHPYLAISINSLAVVLQKQGRFAEALEAHRDALQMQIALLGSNHVDVAVSLNNSAEVLRLLGRPADAEPLFHRALEILQTLQGDYPRETAAVKNNLGRALREQKRLDAAESLQQEVLEFRRTRFGREHPSVATSLNDLALVQHDQGRRAEASKTFQEALGLPTEPAVRAVILENLGRTLVAAGRPAEAQPLVEQCIALRDEHQTNHWRGFSARALLGTVLLARNQRAEAERSLLTGYEGMQSRTDIMPAEGKLRLKETVEQIVRLYEVLGNLAQAAEWQRKLPESAKEVSGPNR